jgi:phosphoglucomutase
VWSLTSLLVYPRSMQSVVRDSLALHPPQREGRSAMRKRSISVSMTDRLVDMLEHVW